MGAQSFDDEIAQVKSRDRANRYFAHNNDIILMTPSRDFVYLRIELLQMSCPVQPYGPTSPLWHL